MSDGAFRDHFSVHVVGGATREFQILMRFNQNYYATHLHTHLNLVVSD